MKIISSGISLYVHLSLQYGAAFSWCVDWQMLFNVVLRSFAPKNIKVEGVKQAPSLTNLQPMECTA